MAPEPNGSAYVLYGADDRSERFEVSDPAALAVADATAMLLGGAWLTSYSNGDVGIDSSFTLQDYLDVCPTEPYAQQPVPGECTAFLVADDLVATAGHCVSDALCSDTFFVFGYHYEGPNALRDVVSADDVYVCEEVVTRATLGTLDYGLVRLERPVVNRVPLDVRRTGTVSVGTPVLVASHPMGLPLKISRNATVQSSTANHYFETNVDVYNGSSGAPVVNAFTLRVEGLLARGNPDFLWNGTCNESLTCPDSGCPWWEEATRVTLFEAYIPSYGSGSYAACVDDRFEENDDEATATPLDPGFYEDLSVCSTSGDWYAVEVRAGEVMRVEISFDHASGDLDMDVYDGTMLMDWGSSVTDDEFVEIVASVDTTLFVHVYGYLGADNGYDLSVDVGSTMMSILQLDGSPTALAGQSYTWTTAGAYPGERVVFVTGSQFGVTRVPGCSGTVIPSGGVLVVGVAVADAAGQASLSRVLPVGLSGSTRDFWSVSRTMCSVSNPLVVDVL
jgi:hypothetical protein